MGRAEGVGLLAAGVLALAACAPAPVTSPTPVPAPVPTRTSAPSTLEATRVTASTVAPTLTAASQAAPATPSPVAAGTTATATAPVATATRQPATAGPATVPPSPTGTAAARPAPSPAPPAPYALITNREGKQVKVTLEIAASPQTRAMGLSKRSSLPPYAGMLFVFPADHQSAFWMKDTWIPLSIAFIAADGRIVDIQDMEANTEDTHQPPSPYRNALEVNRGFFAENGVRAGDKVEYRLGGN